MWEQMQMFVTLIKKFDIKLLSLIHVRVMNNTMLMF